jgi:hypothetical protein
MKDVAKEVLNETCTIQQFIAALRDKNDTVTKLVGADISKCLDGKHYLAHLSFSDCPSSIHQSVCLLNLTFSTSPEPLGQFSTDLAQRGEFKIVQMKDNAPAQVEIIAKE